ncbi:hypothetical protein ILUMI_00111 [Ignelater luminosus]|uniref:Uncharacterized protein n=1 Tax=Ignelater luminosus TaxID=2038154 RepID=A0A8K0DMH1_IGNLU|nr:hypothetical protein ILUMI_00111 [Ignelater luminosus]
MPEEFGGDSESSEVLADLTLGDILKELRLMRTEQSELIRSVNLCHDKIEECNSDLTRQETVMKEYLQRIETLEAKNSTLEKENSTLRQMEQYSRLNLVKIYGVPEPPNEEILNTIYTIVPALDFKMDKNMIDACHRLQKNHAKPSDHRGIVVKFVSRLDKEEFIKRRRIKRNFNTSHLLSLLPFIQNHPETTIYVNDSLTTDNRSYEEQTSKRHFREDTELQWLLAVFPPDMNHHEDTNSQSEDDDEDVHEHVCECNEDDGGIKI